MPFLWLFISSISNAKELLSVPPHWIPREPTLRNYVQIFFGVGSSMLGPVSAFRFTILNSLIVAGVTTLICLALGSLSAFAFARLNFRGKTALFSSILLAQMVPVIGAVIPLYVVFRKFNLIDTKTALIASYVAFVLPLTIWVLRGYFESIPREIEEAARIDGCTTVQSLFKVTIPLAGPGLVSAGAFSFLWAWNEFMLALIFTHTTSAKTIPVAITEFSTQHSYDYSMMCTGGVLAAIPPFLLAFAFQRYIIRGLTAGATKG